MRIGMVVDNGFFGDLRVENEVMSLIDAGFDVKVLCFEHKNKNVENAEFHGAEIIRTYLPLQFKKKMKGLTNFIVDPYSYYWSKQIINYVKDFQIDVLHIHDLYLLGAAYRANKKLTNKKLIVSDLHENYPAALKYYKFSTTFPGNVLISVPKWKRTEKKWVKKADYVITVIEEANERCESLGAKQPVVVANYVNRSVFLGDSRIDSSLSDSKEFSALYVGGFDTHRGLEATIKAIPFITPTIPQFKLTLVGAGSNENDLKDLAKQLHVEESVSFEGWQAPKNLPNYINASNICLIPHLKTDHTDNTIPHKLFQYMLFKKPIIATDCKPIERIVNETKTGLIYPSNNAEEFAKRVIEMFNNQSNMKEMGERGFTAVQNTYNWENTAQNLITLYSEIKEKHF